MGYFIDDIRNSLKSLFQKEGRAFISPDELNSAANYVQSKIIRESFDFLNVLKNRKIIGRVGKNDFEKEMFYREAVRKLAKNDVIAKSSNRFPFPDDYSFTEVVNYGNIEVAEIPDSLRSIQNRNLSTPSEYYPVYLYHADSMEVIPDTIDEVTLYYYRLANKVNWTYQGEFPNETFDQDKTDFQDFDLSENLFDLVLSELALYLGIQLKQPDVTQAFDRETTQSAALKNVD